MTAGDTVNLIGNERFEILRERNHRNAVLPGDHWSDYPSVSGRLPQHQARIVCFLKLTPIRQDRNAKLSQSLQRRPDR